MTAATPTGPDVVSSYLTLAGAALADRSITTDVINLGRYHYLCRGCGKEGWGDVDLGYITREAIEHAERCRALPRPAAGGDR